MEIALAGFVVVLLIFTNLFLLLWYKRLKTDYVELESKYNHAIKEKDYAQQTLSEYIEQYNKDIKNHNQDIKNYNDKIKELNAFIDNFNRAAVEELKILIEAGHSSLNYIKNRVLVTRPSNIDV